MITFQDYEKAPNKTEFIQQALAKYTGSAEYRRAKMEAEYMAGRDTAIVETTKVIYNMLGQPMNDFTAANNRISSNITHRLISQRCSYLLGKGVSFSGTKQKRGADGRTHTVDAVKDALGDKFDNVVFRAAYWACGNGESYTYVHKSHYADKWEYDLFKKAEFLALYDGYTGKLRGGIRFWSLNWSDEAQPITAILYTEEGYQKFQTREGERGFGALYPVEQMRPYEETVQYTQADGEQVIGGGNYTTIPIIPLYANESHTSALENLKPKIDALDLALSGFANDMEDVATVYWVVNGGMGMDDKDLEKMRDKAKLLHFVHIDGDNGSITPHTTEPPYNARQAFIEQIIERIYADFGALDVSKISAAQKTATEIRAAYQAMDEEADAFEYQLIEYVQQILSIVGLEGMPQFPRNPVINEKEQAEVIIDAYTNNLIDRETALRKLSFITVDEVQDILNSMDALETADKKKLEELRKAMEAEDDQTRENGTEDRPDNAGNGIQA